MLIWCEHWTRFNKAPDPQYCESECSDKVKSQCVVWKSRQLAKGAAEDHKKEEKTDMTIKSSVKQGLVFFEMLTRNYTDELEEAWRNREDNEGLTVNFSMKIKASGLMRTTVDASMGFVLQKIQDKISGEVDDSQMDLPFPRAADDAEAQGEPVDEGKAEA